MEVGGTDQLRLRISKLKEENAHLQSRHCDQLRFSGALEAINRLIIEAIDLDEMLDRVLQEFLKIFSCDRAWLLYPCDPDSTTYRVPMEKTVPQWPGAKTQGIDIPLDDFARNVFALANATSGAVRFDREVNSDYLDQEVCIRFHIRSQLLMAIYPRVGKPWLLGIHHCAAPTIYSETDCELFETLGSRLADGLSSLLSWLNTKSLFENSEVSIWNVDLSEIRSALDQLSRDGVADLRQYLVGNESVAWDFAAMVKVVQVNQATLALFGARTEDACISAINKIFAANGVGIFIDELCAIWHKQKVFRNEAVLRTLDGKDLNVLITFQIPRSDDGFRSVPISIIDITDRKQADERIRTLSQAVEQSPVSVVITDTDGNIEYVNSTFERITGYRSIDVIGQTSRILKSGETPTSTFVELWKTIGSGQAWHGEFQNRKKSGEIFWEHAHIAPVFDETGAICHYLAVKEDISLRKKQEEHILRQAHFDSLTDLPNRFLALDRLSQLLSEAKRNQNLVAVLFLDLDDFKRINDTLGHEIGDKLLVEAARRLRSVVRSSDTVGRLGGDEFIVLLGGITTAVDTLPAVEHLLDRFRGVFTIDNRELILTASVGIAIYPDDGDTSSELLRKADSAMYHSKEQGRNTYSYFTDAMNQEVSRRLALEEQMYAALNRGEFRLLYQPQADIGSGRIVGIEALLRWHNPVLGEVSPVEFITIAEQNGLIVPIGEFVLAEALGMAAKWLAHLDQPVTMAVNLSPRQFRDSNLVPFIEHTLQRFELPGRYLELEITEGVLMYGHAQVNDALVSLSNLGISIAMDDFGTGYSSLSNLRAYPFDTLKIDRSFINDITVDNADRELVNAAISMAHGLGLKVVAEGVETAEQLELLALQGCDWAQGYFFSKPVSAEEALLLVESRRSLHRLRS